jgi:hypothetical protein
VKASANHGAQNQEMKATWNVIAFCCFCYCLHALAQSSPTITEQPFPRVVNAGQTAQFRAKATNWATLQWQRSTNGGGSWFDLKDQAGILGANWSELEISGTNTLYAGHLFRLTASNNAVTVASLAAPLIVLPPPRLLMAFTNPTPSKVWFGKNVAMAGGDLVLITTPPSFGSNGAVYLFNTNGTLISSFTNPLPSNDDFGACAMAIGADRVLIGAPKTNAGTNQSLGRVYLFGTNGTLLHSFYGSPGLELGRSVAELASGQLLIGTVANVQLWTTNGGFLAHFAPNFATWLATMGNDRVLIGSFNTAYLYRTDRTLLTTFTNPGPSSEYFGQAGAAVGLNRVLIGDSRHDANGLKAGAAYLFSTNGTVVTTYLNPSPTHVYDLFGYSVAAVDEARLLIGAPRDATSGHIDGAVYLLSTNGELKERFSKGTLSLGPDFGDSVAAFGSDRVLIGAPGELNGGAAYLFSLLLSSTPSLSVQRTNSNQAVVSWPSFPPEFQLQETPDAASTNWTEITGPFQNDGITKAFLVNLPNQVRFYRLFKPSAP